MVSDPIYSAPHYAFGFHAFAANRSHIRAAALTRYLVQVSAFQSIALAPHIQVSVTNNDKAVWQFQPRMTVNSIRQITGVFIVLAYYRPA